jgi:exonuclease SbcC
LPFYIFNQRIVKNYNWMKFYLTQKSITWEKWFKNPMYSLSSWQAEGLALSLMLSNNLSYKTDFKTLLIDDPIQSLDDLNILSFINLLRYQFSDKQIVISTHDDGFSRFIRYKFWRLYWDNSQTNINMKEKFFDTKGSY